MNYLYGVVLCALFTRLLGVKACLLRSFFSVRRNILTTTTNTFECLKFKSYPSVFRFEWVHKKIMQLFISQNKLNSHKKNERKNFKNVCKHQLMVDGGWVTLKQSCREFLGEIKLFLGIIYMFEMTLWKDALGSVQFCMSLLVPFCKPFHWLNQQLWSKRVFHFVVSLFEELNKIKWHRKKNRKKFDYWEKWWQKKRRKNIPNTKIKQQDWHRKMQRKYFLACRSFLWKNFSKKAIKIIFETF